MQFENDVLDDDDATADVDEDYQYVSKEEDVDISMRIDYDYNENNMGDFPFNLEECAAQSDAASIKALWRLDPDVSHSDYSIIIHSSSQQEEQRQEESGQEENHGEKKYHVHKVFLSVGPFHSRYLSTIFLQKKQNQYYVENQEDTSIIELPVIAANAFPVILDLIYLQEDQVCSFINDPKMTIGAAFIGDYMKIPAVRRKCVQLVMEENFSPTRGNFPEYYQHVLSLGMNDMIQQIEEHLSQSINILMQMALF